MLAATGQEGSTPGRDTLDLDLDRHREHRPDQHDEAEDHGVLDRRLRRDGADEVGSDQDFEAEQDSGAERVAQEQIGGVTVARPSQRTDGEHHGDEGRPRQQRGRQTGDPEQRGALTAVFEERQFALESN